MWYTPEIHIYSYNNIRN